jgi:hypothetical protein
MLIPKEILIRYRDNDYYSYFNKAMKFLTESLESIICSSSYSETNYSKEIFAECLIELAQIVYKLEHLNSNPEDLHHSLKYIEGLVQIKNIYFDEEVENILTEEIKWHNSEAVYWKFDSKTLYTSFYTI